MATFPIAMNKGDILRYNGIEVNIQNQFILKCYEQGEFYEIDFIKLKIMIDKEKIYDFLNYKGHILNWKLDAKEKFITAKMPNDNEINLINYLAGDYELYGNRAFNTIVIRKDQPYNFRTSNIRKKIKTNLNKSKIIKDASKFFEGEEIVILDSYEGHRKEFGQASNKERNPYRLLTLSKNREIINAPKYYEVFLGKTGQNGDEFSFLIDESDVGILSGITVKNPFYKKEESNELIDSSINNAEISNELSVDGSTIKYNNSNVKNEYITINNPTWHLLTNQYIAMSYSSIYNSKTISQMFYIHRYLLQNQLTEDEYTVDHINGNKLDNRRSNLRAANMTTQNMNRDMVKRKRTLASIINSFARPGKEIPIELSFDNIEFIIYFSENVKTKKGITIRNGFSIEFKSNRSGTEKGIEDSSTQSVIFKDNPFLAIKVKLAHAICIRYLYACKYNCIIKHNIDNKAFANCNEFKTHSETMISETMGQTYTIDSFLDYMMTFKIPKYIDSRQTIHSGDTSTNASDLLQNTNPLVANTPPATPLKFDFLNYSTARVKYDVSIVIGKYDSGANIKYSKSGCGSDKLSLEDKKAFALVQRYNAFIEIENDLNEKIHSTPNTPASEQQLVETNPNITGLKSLTDYKLEGRTMLSFTELRTHTELLINQLLTSSTPYTMETFASYANKKAASKKIQLDIAKLKYDYTILTK